jgi:hypothetical protein
MKTPIHLEGHLSKDAIEERHRQAKESVAKTIGRLSGCFPEGKRLKGLLM